MNSKIRISWPTLISSIAMVASFTLHPVLTHFVLTGLQFSFPATLAVIQVSITAACLWFWTLFGLYHVRAIPLPSLLPLAASTAALSLLAVFTLATTSVLVFQTARLLSATAVLATRAKTPVVLPLAFISSALLMLRNDGSLVIPLCYAVFASTNALFLRPIAARTRASELQLQVLVRTLAAVLLLPPAVLLDYHVDATLTIRHFIFNDISFAWVVSTGLIAFVSFTTSRATTHRLGPELHSWFLLVANLAVFMCHFVTTDDELHASDLLGVLGLAGSWSFLAEKRKCCSQHRSEQRESLPHQLV